MYSVSIIAELNFWSDDIVLASTIDRVPSLVLYDYRAVATDPRRPHLFFWTRVADFDAFEAAMADDETVAEYEYYGSRDVGARTERLYRIHVSERTEVVLYPAWVRSRSDVIEGGLTDGRWYGRMRFPDRERFDRLRAYCDDHGVDLTVEAIYTESDARSGPLTDEQQRTLSLAAEMGYFEVPRQATLADLAAELDRSEQAVSERLRRACRALVDRHVR